VSAAVLEGDALEDDSYEASEIEAFFAASDDDDADVYDDETSVAWAMPPVGTSSLPDVAAEKDDALNDDSLTARLQRIRSVANEANLEFETDENEYEAPSSHAEVAAELNALLMSEQDAPFAAEENETGDVEALADTDAMADFDVSVEDAPTEPDEVYVEESTLSELLADAVSRGNDSQPAPTEFDEIAEISEEADTDAPLPETELLADAFASQSEPEEQAPEAKAEADDLDDEAVEADPIAEADEPFVLNDGARIMEEAVEALNAPDEDTADAPDFDADPITDNLSPEDEAELQRVLADAEAGLEDVPDAPLKAETSDASLSDLEEIVTRAETIDSVDEPAFEPEPEEEKAPALETDGLDTPETSEPDETPAAQDMTVAADPETPHRDLSDMAEDASEEPGEATEPMPATGKLRRGLARLLGTGKRQDEEEERIFDEADHKMGDSDSNMRRTAIQHLRAAVAATRAEKKAGVDVDQGADETPYRTDLARVVKPRRPDAGSAVAPRSQRPVEQRAAPLKLVAEQRVDLDRAPVLPRRVATADLTPAATDGSISGFTEFAEARGATELSELLEAAAAYMSDVEGREEFSRPMLMSKLKEVQHEQYSREDGLRSFGKLLRTGKLRKLKGGRFSVTEETDYRDEARNVG